jgi:hypothetical protein
VVTLDSRSTPAVSAAIRCPDPNPNPAPTGCNNGPVLISFQGDQVPSLDAASAQTAANSDRFIALTQDGVAGKLPLTDDTPTTFLTPQLFTGNSTDLEAGTPLIDASGHLTGLYSASTSSLLALGDISSLITQIPLPLSPPTENTVNTNWKKGIDDYYNKKNYAAARTDFQQAANGNANFQGAKDFVTFAQKAQDLSTTSSGSQQTSPSYSLFGIRVGLWESSVIALAVFAVLLLLTSAIVRSRVERRRAFQSELDDATRRSASVAQEIERMEAAQRTPNRTSQQSTSPIQQQVLQDKAVVRKLARNLLCSRCGELIDRDAKYCPNCRLALTSSESGLDSQSASSAPSHTDLTTRVVFDTTDIKADINANQIIKQEGG